MDDLDKSFIRAILHALEEKLGRNLVTSEWQAFSIRRSLVAYEMIIDYITDNTKTIEDIEQYVKNVVNKHNSASTK